MSPEEIRALATEIASPSNQWVSWLVIGVICILTGIGHYLVARFKKSGEIRATTDLLDEVVTQTKAIADAQENIRQKMADAIWRDQRKWDLEFELYEELMTSLGKSAQLYGQLKSPEVHKSQTKPQELYTRDMELLNQRLALINRASMLMPAEIYSEFHKKLNLVGITDNEPESLEALCEKFAALEDSFTNAAVFVCSHARRRFGVN